MCSEMLHRVETSKKGGDNSAESTIIYSIDGGRLSMRTLVPSALALVLGAGIASATTVTDLSPGYFALSKIGKDRAAEAGSPRSPAISEYIAGGFHPGEMRSFAHGSPGTSDEQLTLFERKVSYKSTAESLASMQVGADTLGLDAMTVASASPFAQLFNTATMAAMAVTSAISALFDFSPTEVVLLNGVGDGVAAMPALQSKTAAAAVNRAFKGTQAGPADGRSILASFSAMAGGGGSGGGSNNDGASERTSLAVANGLPSIHSKPRTSNTLPL